MRKIAVSLSKGGVGKTSTAVNLAHGLAQSGKKVLLIDTDTQGQAAMFLGVHPMLSAQHGVAPLVAGEIAGDEAVIRARENLWLLAGGRALAGVRSFIDRKDYARERTFEEVFTSLETQYDIAVLDTAPGWDSLTVNALFYANEVLIPASLEPATLQGLPEYFSSIERIQQHHPKLSVRYIVPTFLDNRVRQSREVLDQLVKYYGTLVTEPIRYNIKVSEASGWGKTIYEYAPKSAGACDYDRLSRTVNGD